MYHSSHWPITGSCALLLMAVGAASWFNPTLGWLVLRGSVLVTMMFGWISDASSTSGRHHNKKVDLSFRWG
jgi:hypothetical protein